MREKRVDTRGRPIHGHIVDDGKALRLEERDKAAFRVLAEFRFARTRFIYDLMPEDVRGTWYGFRNRMTLLFQRKRTPHGGRYIEWPKDQRLPYGAHYSLPAIWRLTSAGLRAIGEDANNNVNRFYGQHMSGSTRQLAHTMMAWDTIESLRIGVNADPDVEWISWRTILDRSPQQTREAKDPFKLPVKIAYLSSPESQLATSSA